MIMQAAIAGEAAMPDARCACGCTRARHRKDWAAACLDCGCPMFLTPASKTVLPAVRAHRPP